MRHDTERIAVVGVGIAAALYALQDAVKARAPLCATTARTEARFHRNVEMNDDELHFTASGEL